MLRTCKTPHEYSGVQRKPGEQFEVEQQHVELLVGLGRIEREEGDVVPAHVSRDQAASWPASGYLTRDMNAAPAGRRSQRKTA